MNDVLLTLASAESVATSNTAHVIDLSTITPGRETWFVSDLVPSVGIGTERMALEIVCHTALANSATVTAYLMSFDSDVFVPTIATELFTGGAGLYIHWASTAVAQSAYTRGRRMATIPLPPVLEYKQFLGLAMSFSVPCTGAMTAHIAPMTNAKFSQFPNAI